MVRASEKVWIEDFSQNSHENINILYFQIRLSVTCIDELKTLADPMGMTADVIRLA